MKPEDIATIIAKANAGLATSLGIIAAVRTIRHAFVMEAGEPLPKLADSLEEFERVGEKVLDENRQWFLDRDLLPPD